MPQLDRGSYLVLVLSFGVFCVLVLVLTRGWGGLIWNIVLREKALLKLENLHNRINKG